MTPSPRQKLLVATAAAVAVPLLAVLATPSAAGAARAVLVAGALVGLVAWGTRAAVRPGAFRAAPRMKLVQRVGLSARAGLALVELDGRAWLVAHGDGFARVRPVPSPRVAVPLPAPTPLPAARDHAPGLRHPSKGKPGTRATRSPTRLVHLRLQDPLEDCYVASLVPPSGPGAPPAREPTLSLVPRRLAVRP